MTVEGRSDVRVLQVLPRSAGGIGHHVADLVRSLDGRDGISIEIVTPSGSTVALPKPPIELDIPRGLRGHGRTVAELRRVAARTGAHVVHAHGLRAGVDAGLAARLARLPQALTVHNLVLDEREGPRRAAFLRTIEGVAVRLAHAVFAPSEEIASHLREKVPSASSRIEVVYLAPERPSVRRPREVVRADLGVAASQRMVVSVMRLVAQKAPHVLLDALARLPPDLLLVVVGEGPLREALERDAARLGVVERVRWLGWRTDVGDLIAAADAFALSSVWEAVALAAQEAVQLGTPVAATDVGGMSELIADRRSGRLVAAGDAASLAAAIAEVACTETGRRYAERAARDYEERFSRSRAMARLKDAYRRLAAGSARAVDAG